MDILAEPISHIIVPLTLEYISIRMIELTFTIGFIIFPMTFVSTIIRPYMNPITMPTLIQPLSFVFGSIRKLIHISLYDLLLFLGIEYKVAFQAFILLSHDPLFLIYPVL